MKQTLQALSGSPAAIALLWCALALFAVVLFVAFRPRRVLLAADAGGRLLITRRALHRLIEASCEQVRGIASARARISGTSGKFQTHIRLKIRPNAKLDAIQGYLKQEVAEIFRQNLGIANEGRVEIEIVGVASDDKPI